MALLGAFLVVPVVEIVLFIVVGRYIGLAATIAIVLATAVLGSWLVARQGRETLARFGSEMGEGRFPASTMAHGGMILVAGALLLTPGFLTDAVGFVLLLPPVREWIRLAVTRRYRDRWTVVP